MITAICCLKLVASNGKEGAKEPAVSHFLNETAAERADFSLKRNGATPLVFFPSAATF